MRKGLKRNIKLLYIGTVLLELTFFVPIFVPFLSEFGLTMQEILFLESSFALTLVILEIPSGYFADIFGRKLSVILASILYVIAAGVLAFSTEFWGFFASQVIWGIGASFGSGSTEALTYDTLAEMKKEDDYKKVNGNTFMLGRISAVLSNLIGPFLAVLILRLPFYLTVGAFAIWVPLSFLLIEPKRYKNEFEHWNHFKRILIESFKDKKLLWFIIYASLFPAFAIIGFWQYQKYFELIGFPIILFGLAIAMIGLGSAFGAKFNKEIEKLFTPKGALLLIPILPGIIWIILGNFASWWLILIIPFVSMCWGLSFPIYNEFIQKITTSDRRATVLSMKNMLSKLLFFTFSPFLGWITDFYSVQYALYLSGISIICFTVLIALKLRRVKII